MVPRLLCLVVASSCGFPTGLHMRQCRRWGGRRDSSVPRPDAGVSFSGCGHKDLGYCNPDSTRRSTMERISCLSVQAMNFHSGPRPTAHTAQACVFLRVIWCHAASPTQSPWQVRARWAVVGRLGPFQGHSNFRQACWQDPKSPCHPLTISNWAESFLHQVSREPKPEKISSTQRLTLRKRCYIKDSC